MVYVSFFFNCCSKGVWDSVGVCVFMFNKMVVMFDVNVIIVRWY